MDPSLPNGIPTIELVSESDSDDLDAHLVMHPRVNGVNGVHDLDALDTEGDESEDGWDDIESLFEDTIEEMGDEHLFDGGESLRAS
jgi:NAD-dependent histone deacetylase SIR2